MHSACANRYPDGPKQHDRTQSLHPVSRCLSITPSFTWAIDRPSDGTRRRDHRHATSGSGGSEADFIVVDQDSRPCEGFHLGFGHRQPDRLPEFIWESAGPGRGDHIAIPEWRDSLLSDDGADEIQWRDFLVDVL